MPDIHTLYLVHHSHTDIGYTHDQPIVWEMQRRALLEAMNLAEQHAHSDDAGAFRWTLETTAVLEYWLERASPPEIERLIALERAGRVEVTGMFANMTPLADIDQLIESLRLVRRLRADYGFNICSAMNGDVNGASWALADLLPDAGITGFSMAINPHSGGAMKPRPCVFLWQGPAGRRLPTFNGWPYNQGWTLGIGHDADELESKWWPRAQAYLHQIGYPLPILMIQTFHPFGDNATAFDYTPFIRAWNDQGKTPRILMATPRMWWQAVQPYLDQLPVLSGDWTDFWSFGTISSAREEAISRASRARLRQADTLLAVHRALPETPQQPDNGRWLEQSAAYRDEAWRLLNLWAEHSWGADDSVWYPDSEDSVGGWYHKAHYAYRARSLSLLIQRDALAELARHISRQNSDDLLVFNPLPWEQTIMGAVRPAVAQPRGLGDDSTSSRHFLDRRQQLRWNPEDLDTLPPDVPRLLIPPTTLPPFGYAVLQRRDLALQAAILETSETDQVETDRFCIRFDRTQGGISSFYDRALAWEWVDAASGCTLHTVVHEQVADKQAKVPRKLIYDHPWPTEAVEIPSGWKRGWHARRSRPAAVLSHKVYRTPLGWSVIQELELDAVEGTLLQRFFVPHDAGYLDCEAAWRMGPTTYPESFYILFPFNLPQATARYDIGGQAVIPGEAQLPGVCRDYFTAQGWINFSNDRFGMTVTLPENPLFQLGDFHFGDYQSAFALERPMLLSWVTSNYWETNFRAHQPGLVHARYRLHPSAGAFEAGQAHRWGQEALYHEPLLQPMSELPVNALPARGSLLHLPQPPVMVLHVKPAEDNAGIIIRLLNTSDLPQTAEIASGLIHIVGAQQCSLLEEQQHNLPVTGGRVSITLAAHEIRVLRLDLDR